MKRTLVFASVLFGLIAIIATSTEAHVFRQNPDARTAEAVAKFDALPKVNKSAPGAEESIAIYIKERKTFVESIAYRNLESCRSREHEFTSVKHKIIIPKAGFFSSEKSYLLPNLELHEAREHGAKLTPAAIDFILGLSIDRT